MRTLNMLYLPLYKMYKKYFKLKGTNMFDQGGAHTNGVVIHEAMKTYRGRDVQEMAGR